MMRLKVEEVGRGLHPNETVVAVKGSDGLERLVVPRQSIADGSIEIGWPIRANSTGDLFLIELPRETQSGAWRVWVPRSQIFEEKERMRA
jgi:hypothetical protein